MKKKTDRISDALGRLPLDLIKESAEYDAAAVRARRLRVSVIVAAALLVAVAVPFGILLSRGGSGTDPVGTGEISTANFLSGDTTDPGTSETLPGTSDTLPPDVTTDVPDTGTEPVAPAVIENPTGPSFGGGMTTLSAEIPAELASLTVSAEGGDSKIVPVDSSFIVRTAQPTTAAVIASNLSVSPATPLSITKLSDTEYRLTPASGDLTPGKIYRFTLGDPDEPAATFSFQTEKALAVSGMLPADGSGIVPLNTGIEVSFTEAIDPDDANDAFSLSPAVKGRYMLYPDGRTVAFIPEKPLSYGTSYTVTVREGIRSVSGKTLAEGKTAKFMTITREEEMLEEKYDEPDGFFYYYIDASSTSSAARGVYAPGSAVSLEISICPLSPNGINTVFDTVCDLYACPSAADAAAFMLKSNQYRFENDPDALMSSFTFIDSYNCTGKEGNRYRFTADLGSALPRGIYIGLIRVKATQPDGSVLDDYTFSVFQITDLMVWTVSDESDTYVWLNRAYTGPEAGAKITAVVMKDGELSSSSSSSVTGEDGLARIDNPSGIYTRILIAESGEDCLLIQSDRSETPDETQGYYGAVYTDREKYFSTDTVSFSGFIAASDGGPLPGKLFLTTGYSALDTAVEVDETGFFTGSISFEDFGSGYIWLRFTDEDGRLIFNKAVFTTEEPKPRISASIGFDRSYYEKGDRVNAVLKAGFFDGTPVEGIEFIYYLSPFGISGSGRTDERGEIHISFAAEKVSASSTDAVTITVTAILTGTELQELTVTASVPYYHSDYLFKSSMTDEGMLIELNLRDLSALETVEGLSKAEIDALTAGDPVDGKQVQYTVMINRVKRTKETRYDTYGKVTYSGWKYEVVRSVEKTGTAEFSGGRILIPRVTTADPDVWFSVTVTFSDNTSPSSGAHDFNQYEVSADCTVRTGNSGKQPVGDSSFSSSKGTLYPEIVLNGRSFVCGDTVSAEIFLAGEKINALIFVISSKIEFAACSDGISFEFTPEMCQGGSVRAICYNAESNSFGWTERGFGFNFESNLLEPEIETDKTEYRPGETATVEISVPGLGEGTVIVSIVDEACFALKDQKIDPLSYRSMVSKNDRVYIGQQNAPGIDFISRNNYLSMRWMSYKFPSGMGGDSPTYTGDWSPAGSPDAAYVRKDFLDNPVFATLKTDAEGRATLSFTVPDNITSWRITVIAVGTGGGINELKTGSALSNTVCTLPFFIDPDCCQKYVEGDTVTAGLRAYGKAAEGEVTYRGYLVGESGETAGMIETVADCGEKTWLRFEGVKEGRYKLTVYAYCGRYSDACEYELDVVKTAAAADVTKILTAEELKDLKPAYYPVRLTVSEDTGELRLFEQIRNYLSAARGSSRTDEYAALLAALSASDLFYGGNTADRRELLIEEILKRYNFGDAAFRLLPYSEGDSALTAGLMQLGIITDGSILKSLIERSYASIASSVQLSPEELCRTLAILASAGEPVMDILQRVESGSEGFSDEAKLWLALGCCSAVEHDGARRRYSAVRKASAAENAEYRTLGFGSGSVTERVRVSSVALLCASVTDREDAAMIARWLLENRTDTESPQIALAAFLLRCRPAEGQKGIEFEYSLGEEKNKIRLDPGQSWTFVLCREDLERLELSLPENALLLANYRGELDASQSADSGRFTIEKTYEATEEGFCLVTLTLSGKSTRTCESFEIYDLIPSGARFFSAEIRDGNRLSDVSNTSGQNISCFVTVRYPHDEIEGIAQAQGDVVTDCPEYEFSVRIGYVIRAALQGDFIAESAWAENTDTGERAMSRRSLLTIGSGGVWSTSALPEAQ